MELRILFWCLVLDFLNSAPPCARASVITNTRSKEHLEMVNPTEKVCETEICRRSAEYILRHINKHADPCEDFYEFACGGNRVAVPYSSNDMLHSYAAVYSQMYSQWTEILEEESPPNELHALKLAKTFYKSCMNTGLKPLHDILKGLGGWPVVEGDDWDEDNFDWVKFALKLKDFDFVDEHTPFFINLNVDDFKYNGSFNTFLTITNFPPRELTNLGNFNYVYNRTVDLAVKLNADEGRAKKEIADVLAFMQKLKSISRSSLNDNKPVTIAKLTKYLPSIPWIEYIQSMLPEGVVIDKDQLIIVRDRLFVTHIGSLINGVSKRVQANYMIMNIVKSLMRFLTSEVSQKPKNRGIFCRNIVSKYLPLSIDALYIRKYSKKDIKTSVSEIVENIRRQFRILLENADWIDKETRRHVLDEIDSMETEVGHSAELMDDEKLEEFFKGLVLDENEFLKNYLDISRFSRMTRFNALTSPANETNLRSALKDAHYDPKANKVFLPAVILQDFIFNSHRPKYLNYGAIGWKIGHEIAHSFDSEENLFYHSKYPSYRNNKTAEKFALKTQCMIDQYGTYYVESNGQHLNGTFTLAENIADNSGIKVAYLAYKDWVQRNGPEPTLPGLPYTPNQMFWITAANHCCSVVPNLNITVDNDDVHSPDKFRVLGSASNSPEFSGDFNCPVGSKMNPRTKCSVW